MSAKYLNELHFRVRRRLFTEDVVENSDLNKEIVDDDKSKKNPSNFDDDDRDQIVAEFLELCDVDARADATPQAVRSNDLDSKTREETPKQQIYRALVISMAPEISPITEYIAQAYQSNKDWKMKITSAKPDEALELTNGNLYDVIFTDVDLAVDNEMLRIIIAMRKLSCMNHETPILAVDQNRSHYRDYSEQEFLYNRKALWIFRNGQIGIVVVNDLTYYGVSWVYFAPLKVEHIREAIERLTKKDDDVTAELENQHKEHDYGLPSYTALEIPTYESFTIPSTSKQTSETTSLPCDAPQYPKIVSVIETSNGVNKTTLSVIKPTVQCLTSEKIVTPATKTKTHTEKQKNVVRPIMQKPNVNLLPKTIFHPPNHQLSNDNVKNNAQFAQHYYEMLSKFPTEFSYMVSGQNLATNEITILPEDITKHSTKERMRRERIKRCSDEFRALLPSCIHNKQAKRMDMATLMERTVFYLKLLQQNATPKYLKECEEIFEFFFYHTAPASKCKRKASEAGIDEQTAFQSKRMNLSGGKQNDKKSTAPIVSHFPSYETIASNNKTIPEALPQPPSTFSTVPTTAVSAHHPSTSHRHQFSQFRYVDSAVKSNYLFRPQYPVNFHNQPVHLPSIRLPQLHTVYGGYHVNNGSGSLQARQQQNMYPINTLVVNGYQTDPTNFMYSPSRQTFKM